MPLKLQTGYEVRCPRCGCWHPVAKPYTTGTDYSLSMLFFQCRGSSYFAGTEGHESRHEARAPGVRPFAGTAFPQEE